MNKKHENLDLVYNYFNFNKFNFTDETFNMLSADKKNLHLQKFFSKINELQNGKI